MSSNYDTPDAELLERYRQASRTEALAPRDGVRAAILEEGRRVAATVSATSSLEQATAQAGPLENDRLRHGGNDTAGRGRDSAGALAA